VPRRHKAAKVGKAGQERQKNVCDEQTIFKLIAQTNIGLKTLQLGCAPH
jgi:hypothetical protein